MAALTAVPAKTDLPALVRRALNTLRIPAHLLGYHYLAYVIERVATDPIRVNGVTKDLYPEMARYFSTTWRAAEHNIRTAISACWNTGGRKALDEMAGYHLTERPCATQLIAIVATHINGADNP